MILHAQDSDGCSSAQGNLVESILMVIPYFAETTAWQSISDGQFSVTPYQRVQGSNYPI
jgi:hypothetical protein